METFFTTVSEYLSTVDIAAVLADVNIVSISVRIIMSMICGGVVGIERGRARQAAGMRTYMLVCMGAATVMLTGQYMYEFFGTGDPARLGAQVISGIGFLGAGGIIISNEKIKGLTTAAGLWVSACIGLSIGIGFYAGGIVFTIMVYLILSKFRKIERRINKKHRDGKKKPEVKKAVKNFKSIKI